MALALRAGAVVRDLEFVQFHPTVMWLGPRLARPAAADLRGGARRGRVPRRRRRRAVHAGPARARRPRAARRGRQGDHAPDARDRRRARVARRPRTSARRSGSAASRPSSRRCRAHGVDPVTELIPVAPACHYASGGVRTDLHGRVVGARPVRVRRGRLHRRARREPAGLQLAARGLVFCRRIADDIVARLVAPSGRRRARRRPSAPPDAARRPARPADCSG